MKLSCCCAVAALLFISCFLSICVCGIKIPKSGTVAGEYQFSDMSDLSDGDDDIQRSPKSRGVQFMITNRMKRILNEDLGYLPQEILTMEPQIAAVVIERKLRRPAEGMPAAWQRVDIQPTTGSLQLKKAMTFMLGSAKNAAPIILPLIGVIWASPHAVSYIRRCLDGSKKETNNDIPSTTRLSKLKSSKSNPGSINTGALDKIQRLSLWDQLDVLRSKLFRS